MKCEFLDSCSFILSRTLAAPFTSKMTRLKYCELAQDGCARFNAYQIMDADMVPHDLWPNLEIKTLEQIEKRLTATAHSNRIADVECD